MSERRTKNEAKAVVLRYLLGQVDQDLTALQISQGTGLELHSTYNVLNRLRKSSLVSRHRKKVGTGPKSLVYVYTVPTVSLRIGGESSMFQRARAKLEKYEAET